MAPEKPAVVVFAGAYHKGSSMSPFIDSLRRAGYEADAYTLPSAGDPSKVTADDEACMRVEIAKRFESGKDVLYIAHSFAGIAASGAIAGLHKKSRAERNEKHGIVGVIFLTAFVPMEGESLLDILEENHPSMEVKAEEGIVVMHDSEANLYNDCTPEVAQAAKAALVPHSLQSFTKPPSSAGWLEPAFEGSRGYVRCLQDNIILLKMQDSYLQKTGSKWVVKTMDTSHSPFLSKPDELTQVITDMMQEFNEAA